LHLQCLRHNWTHQFAGAAPTSLPWGGAAGAPPQPGQSMQQEMSFSQTGREERANAASHALGCVLALLAMPALRASTRCASWG
jgi:hypothetical protein